jgi:hypothetical protein
MVCTHFKKAYQREALRGRLTYFDTEGRTPVMAYHAWKIVVGYLILLSMVYWYCGHRV